MSLACVEGGSWALAYLSVRSWACLAETVSLFDRHFQSFIYCFNEFFGQWRGPAVEHAEAAEIISIDYRVLSEQQDHWWDHVRKRYLMFLNNGTKLLNVELWHHDQRETAVETLTYQTIQA